MGNPSPAVKRPTSPQRSRTNPPTRHDKVLGGSSLKPHWIMVRGKKIGLAVPQMNFDPALAAFELRQQGVFKR